MVDFPAPDLPSIPKISPFFTENETLFNIFFFIYILILLEYSCFTMLC